MKEIDRAATEVLVAAIAVTGIGPAVVFCDYAGHVNSLFVRVHLRGWESVPPKDQWDWERVVYLDEGSALAKLRELRRDILSILLDANEVATVAKEG